MADLTQEAQDILADIGDTAERIQDVATALGNQTFRSADDIETLRRAQREISHGCLILNQSRN